ncbi:cytosine permease [Pseudomonas sp. 148P]|uniref:Cytosine permease n=1 Tax=Pseudomonas ulcerans TaxID=3115852 RepID=A0ABU7HTD6_9PSED|nr:MULTISPECIES: cytosine permease [unclassified Pseudomonas]MEE1923318.1 cytosine permease [Pseudomonas sp. 147P]MEE1934806.1 cytosine permease [Pseudomonas sp. 148P]
MEIESRSVEFIPENERYGSPKRLFTIWCSANMQVTTMVIGALGIVAGLNLGWTVLGLILGNLIGSIFMAAHSAQGPHLGIPQMIQSRAQFGVVGAGLPLAIVVLAYILFTAANGVVMRDSIKAVVPVSDNDAIILFGVLTLIVGYVGYELIHRIGVWMSAISSIIFALAAYTVLQHGLPEGVWQLSASTFKFAVFCLVVTQAASWTLGAGPYVADYSRYLPTSTATRSTFWYSYLGILVGSSVVMLLGAIMATAALDVLSDPGSAIARLFPGYEQLAYFVIIIGVLEWNVMNLYSSYMSTTTIFTGFKGTARIGKLAKFVIMAVVAVIVTWIAIAAQYNFGAYFSDILIGQVYVLVPWSAINLADYYWIRKGRYSVAAMYDVNGIYGKVNWNTLFIYAAAVVIQIPFMELSFYKGPVAQLVGTDISWLPALIVPGVLYYLVNRNKQLHLTPFERTSSVTAPISPLKQA